MDFYNRQLFNIFIVCFDQISFIYCEPILSIEVKSTIIKAMALFSLRTDVKLFVSNSKFPYLVATILLIITGQFFCQTNSNGNKTESVDYHGWKNISCYSVIFKLTHPFQRRLRQTKKGFYNSRYEAVVIIFVSIFSN